MRITALPPTVAPSYDGIELHFMTDVTESNCCGAGLVFGVANLRVALRSQEQLKAEIAQQHNVRTGAGRKYVPYVRRLLAASTDRTDEFVASRLG